MSCESGPLTQLLPSPGLRGCVYLQESSSSIWFYLRPRSPTLQSSCLRRRDPGISPSLNPGVQVPVLPQTQECRPRPSSDPGAQTQALLQIQESRPQPSSHRPRVPASPWSLPARDLWIFYFQGLLTLNPILLGPQGWTGSQPLQECSSPRALEQNQLADFDSLCLLCMCLVLSS